MFKKIAFVALTLLFHIYESWGVGWSAPNLLCCSSNTSGCGYGTQIYAPSICSSYCKAKGYNYYKYVSFYNCNGTGCACYNASAGTYSSLTYKQCAKASCPATSKYWTYPGDWSGTASTYGAYTAFTCRSATSSACSQTNSWTSYSNGMLRQKAKICGGDTSFGSGAGSILECLDSDSLYNYKCNMNYYGILGNSYFVTSPSYGTCSRCPSAIFGTTVTMSGYTTSSGTSTITGCYLSANTTGLSDDTGTWTWTTSCYSCGASQALCSVASDCWSSGFTSCTSQGCCMSSCSTYVCDPTAASTATYGVQSTCYAHSYTSCVNNCCSNYCSTTMCLSGVLDCYTAGYNNNASCISGCCSGIMCTSSYGALGNTTGRCTSDFDCAADTTKIDYGCNTNTGCCVINNNCTTALCSTEAQCTLAGYSKGCNTTTGCCKSGGGAIIDEPIVLCAHGVYPDCDSGYPYEGDDRCCTNLLPSVN